MRDIIHFRSCSLSLNWFDREMKCLTLNKPVELYFLILIPNIFWMRPRLASIEEIFDKRRPTLRINKKLICSQILLAFHVSIPLINNSRFVLKKKSQIEFFRNQELMNGKRQERRI